MLPFSENREELKEQLQMPKYMTLLERDEFFRGLFDEAVNSVRNSAEHLIERMYIEASDCYVRWLKGDHEALAEYEAKVTRIHEIARMIVFQTGNVLSAPDTFR